MRNRSEIKELFSTFLDTAAWGWLLDGELLTNITGAMQRLPAMDENGWACHWLTGFKKEQVNARNHLFSYLQEPYYWAARRCFEIFSKHQLSLADCFQEGLSIPLEKLFSNFDFSRGASLKAYGQMQIESHIYDKLGERPRSKVGLLLRTSKKRRREILAQMGLTGRLLESYLLVWHIFSDSYVSTNSDGRLSEPTLAQYQLCAERFHQLSESGYQQCDAETIAQWLNECVDAIQRGTKVVSLTEIANYCEAASVSAAIELTDETKDQLKLFEAARAVLQKAFAELNDETRLLLILSYGFKLGQSLLAAKLNMNQATVSRRCARGERAILEVFCQWVESAGGVKLTTQLLSQLDQHITAWLSEHTAESINSILSPAFHTLTNQSQLILQSCYGAQLSIEQIATAHHISTAQVNDAIKAAKQLLSTYVVKWIETNFALHLTSGKEQQAITETVENWLENAQYAVIRAGLQGNK